MKYIVVVMVLFTSTAGNLFAQSSKTDETFNVPADFSFGKRFMVDLGKGNKMQVEVSDINDLQRIANIDSILAIFLQDFAPLKDSLKNELASIRIDHMTNAAGTRKIRLLQFPQHGNAFVRQGEELALLKIEQDTINIIGVVNNPPKAQERYISRYDPRYFRIIFYLNNLEDLADYSSGILNEKIPSYLANYTGKWKNKWGKTSGWGPFYLNGDPTIYADKRRATAGGPGDYLSFQFTVNAQNYKNYFVPAFGLGTTLVLSNREKQWKHEIGIQWEPNFLFAKDSEGKVSTFRNDFLTLSYGQGPVKEKDPRKPASFTAIVSLGYLIYRNGEFYDKNTIRIGAGRLKLQKTAIEPGLYFYDFFRNVTPTIRLIQSF
ncbi:hypothetical protein [Flavihumibacter fluvii]|uniref:hypothetical protein n=1 Tax=Flavihumibacter fluvii TaxID=2838157 RepID=UPI001BDF5359|nr:hypothetical protein [Flavihumibacter fluvii]ULQ52570.1 hypothetical protein KJS93_21000 [Flavihumibacter fluvii]